MGAYSYDTLDEFEEAMNKIKEYQKQVKVIDIDKFQEFCKNNL